MAVIQRVTDLKNPVTTHERGKDLIPAHQISVPILSGVCLYVANFPAHADVYS
jgi:hypothetical protein